MGYRHHFHFVEHHFYNLTLFQSTPSYMFRCSILKPVICSGTVTICSNYISKTFWIYMTYIILCQGSSKSCKGSNLPKCILIYQSFSIILRPIVTLRSPNANTAKLSQWNVCNFDFGIHISANSEKRRIIKEIIKVSRGNR